MGGMVVRPDRSRRVDRVVGGARSEWNIRSRGAKMYRVVAKRGERLEMVTSNDNEGGIMIPRW